MNMTESRRQEILREQFFRKISTYILEVSERVDLEPYIPILELLRWLFVPSIEHRILTLLEHFVYNNNNNEDSSCNESPQSFLCDMDSWLEASTKLNKLLRPDGLSRIFVDSILLGNRIARIGRQLDNMGVDVLCESTRSMDYPAESYQSTRCPNHDVATVANNKAVEGRRQSRKRKATYDEEDIPADLSIEDQTERTKQQQQQQQHQCGESRSDKLRLVVTELPTSNEEGYCSSSRRRTDYLKLPCDCRALKEKLFKHQTPKHSGKFDQRLKNVCSCLNNVMDRMDDEAVNDAALSCELRKNYVRFKLGKIKSKLCMFATRVALNRQQRKDKLRENDASSSSSSPRYCWTGNCSGFQRDLANGSSDDMCDRSVNSRKSERGCSTRFLWNPSRHCFATSSVEGDSSGDEKNIFEGNESYDDAANCECKSQKNIKIEENCPCFDEKISDEKETKSPRINERKHCHFETMTDDIEERGNNRAIVELRNAELMTDEVDEPVELTNIYVNEISICCCCEGYDAQEDMGVNTESILEHSNGKCCIEASTNTEGCRIKEISTQVFFKEIQFCTCYKNVDEELEIENVRMENEEFDFNCECNNEMTIDEKIELIEMNNRMAEQNLKETPFDDIIRKLAESPCKSSEFTEIMKVKINEIVDLNEKIRKKVNMIKDNKDVCSVSVQKLIKQKSCDSVNTKIQVKTSVISFKSKVSGKTRASKPSHKESIRVCENPVYEFNNIVDDNSALKKSILTEVTASLEHPILQKLKTDVIYQCVKMSTSSSFADGCFRSDTSSIEKIFIYSESSCYNDSNNSRNTCRCTKKSNFLNFLSDYLTRETFEKFKRILRFILKKLLEKAKQLNELRKSRMRTKCRCYCCRDESSYVECCSSGIETCSCEKNSAPRLSGGGDGDVASATAVSHDSSKECKPAKFTRSAFTCRDVNYATKTTAQRRYRRKRSRRKFVNDVEKSACVENGNGLRRCRTEIFASARENSCAGYPNSLAFTNSWKYCYIR